MDEDTEIAYSTNLLSELKPEPQFVEGSSAISHTICLQYSIKMYGEKIGCSKNEQLFREMKTVDK